MAALKRAAVRALRQHARASDCVFMYTRVIRVVYVCVCVCTRARACICNACVCKSSPLFLVSLSCRFTRRMLSALYPPPSRKVLGRMQTTVFCQERG